MPDCFPVTSNIDYLTLQHTYLKQAIFLGLRVAYWRLPDAQEHHLAIDTSSGQEYDGKYLHSLPPGFLVKPFETTSRSKNTYIKADFYVNSGKGITVSPDLTLSQLKVIKLLCEGQSNDIAFPFSKLPALGGLEKEAGPEAYQTLVKASLEAIERGFLKKVIAARFKSVPVPAGLDPVILFQRLSRQYSSSFISLIYDPAFGCWIGASPELLVQKTRDQLFKTTALAGTQKAVKVTDVSSISWNHKEIEEQALVSRYIVNCFKSIRLREYEEDGPKTVLSGELAHLKTDYVVDMKQVNFENLESTLLELLHPTSAVGGMPRKESMEFIHENEGFDRHLYAGFLGPVNIEMETQLYVNIRCANVSAHAVTLFAGAGITKNSIPEKEWQETSAKMLAIESLLY